MLSFNARRCDFALSIIMDIAALRETMRGFNTLVVKMEEMQTYVEENFLILPTN